MDSYPPAAATGSRALKISVMALIVILVVLAAAFWWYRVREKTVALATGGTMTVAPAGKVISEFPDELVLESGAPLEESYRIELQDGVSQPAISYISSKSFEENIRLFREKLMADGWLIIREADAAQPVTNMYAINGNRELNVTFSVPRAGGVRVVIAQAVK